MRKQINYVILLWGMIFISNVCYADSFNSKAVNFGIFARTPVGMIPGNGNGK